MYSVFSLAFKQLIKHHWPIFLLLHIVALVYVIRRYLIAHHDRDKQDCSARGRSAFSPRPSNENIVAEHDELHGREEIKLRKKRPWERERETESKESRKINEDERSPGNKRLPLYTRVYIRVLYTRKRKRERERGREHSFAVLHFPGRGKRRREREIELRGSSSSGGNALEEKALER